MQVRERLKTPPSEKAIALYFGPRLETGLKDFDHMLRVHKAHAVMLVRQGIIAREVGAALVSVIDDLQQGGLSSMTLDPKLEDLFYNIEAHITARVGPRVAGQLHTGRSRNDLSATISRMHARDHALKNWSVAIDLRQATLELAGQHTDTVMPGYTHLKPAQPITFGYYLSAVANALERDTGRIEQAYKSTNLGTMGAAALAGTSFPVDRQFIATLLGFDGLVENCLDCVASRDYVLELMSALAIIATTVSRVATDLYVWQSDEFAMVELADAISGTSSIMPQKKNPHPLEHAKGRSSQVYGALMASLSAIEGSIFTNNGESGRAGVQQLEMASYESELALGLMEMVMRNISANKDLMADRANRDFSSVTDLADLIVRKCGISFRESHGIVGSTVRQAVQEGKMATDITLAMLNKEAREVIGQDLDLTPDEIIASLEPFSSIQGKVTTGGPSQPEVQRMVVEATERLTVEQGRLEKIKQQLVEADEQLDQAATELTTG